ncbi:MAG: hypothetical protein PWP08_1134 [Methanofollis sp.]|nr:hypothetical protein [Methanofollis sp.]
MMNEMRVDMEGRFQSLMTDAGAGRYLPALRAEGPRVDVCSHEDEVVVVVDLPGAEKEDISLRLVTPRMLEISAVQKGDMEDAQEGYYVRERMYGQMKRMIALPTEVKEEEARATFKNGVIEIRLKKAEAEKGSVISIE